ncbi:MAG: HAD family hydrolase [Pirellulaceae bacterium]
MGIIFDLDGTLVNSRLDFPAMRAEMGLPEGIPILESLQDLPPVDRARLEEILLRHEWEGARAAVLFPGVAECLAELTRRGYPLAIVTRNAREPALDCLERLGIRPHFSQVIAREDGPHKPDPWAIQHICQTWNRPTRQAAMVGDFHFDLRAGRNAGAWAVLFTGGQAVESIESHHLADFHFPTFEEPGPLLEWLTNVL